MIIAIDFDGTFAADPVGWLRALRELRTRGHEIVLVTQRTIEFKAEVYQIWPAEWPVVWAGGFTKRMGCQAANIKPDIWIDDMPDTVDGRALIYSPQVVFDDD